MNFENIQLRLLAKIRQRVHNGEVTERGFAKSVGISQPHIHKVLKGTRALSLENIDLVLRTLNCSLLDFCSEAELRVQMCRTTADTRHQTALPFFEARVGPGAAWKPGIRQAERSSVSWRSAATNRHLGLARLEFDPSMWYSAAGYDLAVLDPTPSPICEQSLYGVAYPHDTRLRRIRHGEKHLYLVSDALEDSPGEWEPALPPGVAGGIVIRGKVLWLGREEAL